jgi:hypothetical protein
MENAKLKRKSFTVEQKVEIIRLIQQESQISAAVKFNLTPTTVNTIYKHREKILDSRSCVTCAVVSATALTGVASVTELYTPFAVTARPTTKVSAAL